MDERRSTMVFFLRNSMILNGGGRGKIKLDQELPKFSQPLRLGAIK